MPRNLRQHAAYARGKQGEFQAAMHLRADGYEILHERHKTPHGEIDLIVMRDDLLVFAEVKARATHADALESLGQRQVKRLFAAAEHFLASLPTPHTGDIRFDMITVAADGTIHHLPNALLVEG